MKYKNGSEIVFGKVKDPLRGGKPMNLHQEIDEEFMRVIGDDEFLGYPFAQSGSGKRFLQFLHTFASRIVESVERKYKKGMMPEGITSGCCNERIRIDEDEQHYCMGCNKHMGGKLQELKEVK